jgi:hypothetical protein
LGREMQTGSGAGSMNQPVKCVLAGLTEVAPTAELGVHCAAQNIINLFERFAGSG